MAGGIATGAAAGAVGLAAGIASGDPTKAFQYATASALGGYKFGESGVSGVQQALNVDGIEKMQERAKYESNEEYKEAKQKEYIKNYQKNIDNQFELEKKYGAKEAKRIMKEDIPTLLDNGVTDMKDITTIMDMKKNGDIKDIDEGIALKKYHSMLGNQDTTKMSKKKRDEWNDTFKERFAKNEKYNGQDHTQMADTLFKKIDKYSKIKFS